MFFSLTKFANSLLALLTGGNKATLYCIFNFLDRGISLTLSQHSDLNYLYERGRQVTTETKEVCFYSKSISLVLLFFCLALSLIEFCTIGRN